MQPYDGDSELVAVDGYHGHPSLHPVAQVRGYGEYLTDFTRLFARSSRTSLAGAAYLHNAVDSQVASLFDYPAGPTRPAVHRPAPRASSSNSCRVGWPPTPGAPYADRCSTPRIAPSKQLLAVAADEISVREQFVLLDEQQVAFDMVLHEVEKARARRSQECRHRLRRAGQRQERDRPVPARRAWPGAAARPCTPPGRDHSRRPCARWPARVPASAVDCSSTSTVHGRRPQRARRAHPRRGAPYPRNVGRTGGPRPRCAADRPQIDELIAAARVPVFLLDEHQVVRPGEIGHACEHRAGARASGLGRTSQHVNLDEQFRCGGSEAYMHWVERLLGLVEVGRARGRRSASSPFAWPRHHRNWSSSSRCQDAAATAPA